jgi:tetratricopeptide (TPR) repeat protein
MKTDEAGQALTQLEIERDNIRQATGFFAGNDPVGGLRLAVALYRYWLLRGRNDEGVRTFADLLGRPEPQLGDARLAARSQLLAANLALFGGDVPAAEAFANAGLSSYRLLGDPDGLAASHTTLSMLARQRGDRGEARRQGVEAVASAERSNDSPLLVVCLNNLAAALQDMGELGEAERLCHRTLELARKAGERLAEAIATHNLADNARLRGDLRLADRFCGRTVRLRIRTGDLPGLANSEATWAVVKAGLGDLISAERLVDDALQHAEMGKVPYGRGAALWARAELNLTTNRPAAAEFGRAIDDLLRVGDHATCLEALSGVAVATENDDVAQRARRAAQFIQRTYSLYLPLHVRRRLEHAASSPVGMPPDEFTAAELEDLLFELRQAEHCSA